MAQTQPAADEPRKVAEYLQEESANTAAAAKVAQPPLAIGDAQRFPQPAPEDRAPVRGSAPDLTEQTVAKLLELAAAMDAGADVSPVELAEVQDPIEAYRKARS